MPLWAQLSAMILDGFFDSEVEVARSWTFGKTSFSGKHNKIKAFIGSS